MGNYVASIGVSFPRPPFFRQIVQWTTLISGVDRFRIGVTDTGEFAIDEYSSGTYYNTYKTKIP